MLGTDYTFFKLRITGKDSNISHNQINFDGEMLFDWCRGCQNYLLLPRRRCAHLPDFLLEHQPPSLDKIIFMY